jgi:EpsI family protein
VFVGADGNAHGIYAHAGQSVELYVAVYATQTQGKELVGYSNSITGAGEVSVEAESNIAPQGRPAVELLVREPDGERYLLWYFYRVGTLQTANSVAAQVWYGVKSLAGAPQSRVVALRASCAADCEAARTALGSFLESSGL